MNGRSVGEWLAANEGAAPPHLIAAVRAALAEGLAADAADLPELAVAAADRIVEALIRDGRTGRDAALALLTADALVTYAFEAASDEPERIGQRAAVAMERLATLR